MGIDDRKEREGGRISSQPTSDEERRSSHSNHPPHSSSWMLWGGGRIPDRTQSDCVAAYMVRDSTILTIVKCEVKVSLRNLIKSAFFLKKYVSFKWRIVHRSDRRKVIGYAGFFSQFVFVPHCGPRGGGGVVC